jgi:hypothetical protein
MVNLDLGLISQDGNGRPVPISMDLHMIKYVIKQRIDEVNVALVYAKII